MLGWQIKAMANPARSDQFKQRLPAGIRFSLKPMTAFERDEAFTYLAKVVKDGPSTAEQAAAARLLGALTPFDEHQEMYLRALRSISNDKTVRQELKTVIDSSAK